MLPVSIWCQDWCPGCNCQAHRLLKGIAIVNTEARGGAHGEAPIVLVETSVKHCKRHRAVVL
jgi:hypothetical protein